jgi:hypothetical protein
LLGFGYPEGPRVFGEATDFVFAKDAVVAKGISLHRHRANRNDASDMLSPHQA